MAGTPRERFLRLYPQLRAQLIRRLGSSDAADDALSDTYLRVDRLPEGRTIENAAGYFYRTAINVATDRRRSQGRFASADAIEAAMEIVDPLPDPLRTLEGHAALELLQRAVTELTPRRRAILEAVRLHDKSCREVAEEMGLSRRTVEMELRHALDHCSEKMRRGGYDYAIPCAKRLSNRE